MTSFTVIGARGFIGRHLVEHLGRLGYACQRPARGEWPLEPGHVIYAAGLSGDFLTRPFDTVRAHVTDLATALQCGGYESFLYLSSTRVYAGAAGTAEESRLLVNPLEKDHLYNLSKLMGESVCVVTGDPTVRIARLSNVYGPELASPMFLDRIVRDAVDQGAISLRSHPDSVKDYIHIDDAVALLVRVSLGGRFPIYNLASGVNVSAGSLSSSLQQLTGCRVEVQEGEEPVVYPVVDISRIRSEFNARPRALLDELPGLIDAYQRSRRAA